MSRSVRALLLPLAAGLLVWLTGCDDAPPAAGESAAPADDHAHKPGAHGGLIVPLGRDNYHAEAVFEKGGTLRLYVLGRDESRVQVAEAQPLEAYARAAGETEAEPFVLAPRPQPGDAPGTTSLFVGQLPAAAVGRNAEVTVSNVTIDGARFRVRFRADPPADDHAAMPVRGDAPSDQEVFLTPGGKYTAADVEANGRALAGVKYKGIPTRHEAAKPGDVMCPISETKANPKFAWVVGGKTYTFCCVPCVKEFVLKAKETPDEVRDPAFYVKK